MLTLNPIQENTTSNRSPILQDWPTIDNTRFTYHPSYDFGEITNPEPINISIKDVIGIESTSHFTSFRLVTLKSPSNVTPNVEFLVEASLNSDIGTMGDTFPITENGLNWEFTPEFLPTIYSSSAVTIGYTYGLNFRIEGKTNTGNWTYVTGFNYKIHFEYSRVKFSPISLLFQYALSSNIFESKNVSINGGNWNVDDIPLYYDITIVSGGVVILNQTTHQKLLGAGPAELTFTLNQNINDFELGQTFAFSQITALINEVFVQERFALFHVTVSEFYINDDNLYFEATKGQTEPLPQYISYFSDQPIDIVAPLFVSAYIEIIDVNGTPTSVIRVKPIAFDYLQPGEYSGEIIVSTMVNGVLEIVTINVFYMLKSTINIPFSFSETNFTLENKAIELSSYRDDAFFNVSITASVYDFYTNIVNSISVPLKVPLFQRIGKIYIGEIIHNLMKSFTNLTTNANQYKLTEIALLVNETTYDNELIRDVPAGNYLFAAGIKPVNPKLFTITNLPTRIFANQSFFVNMLLPIGRYRFAIFKEKTEVASQTKPYFNVSQNKVFTHEILFSDYTINKGDLLTYKVFDFANQVMLEKTFAVLPDGMYFNNIIFEDTFKCKSNIIFSGEFMIESEFTRINNRRVKNNFEGIENINTLDKATLTINTGWILKNDQVIIKELMKTKRAFLQYGSTMLELRPISEKMIEEDSERELIDYTIKFTINKTAHAQAYTY